MRGSGRSLPVWSGPVGWSAMGEQILFSLAARRTRRRGRRRRPQASAGSEISAERLEDEEPVCSGRAQDEEAEEAGEEEEDEEGFGRSLCKLSQKEGLPRRRRQLALIVAATWLLLLLVGEQTAAGGSWPPMTDAHISERIEPSRRQLSASSSALVDEDLTSAKSLVGASTATDRRQKTATGKSTGRLCFRARSRFCSRLHLSLFVLAPLRCA